MFSVSQISFDKKLICIYASVEVEIFKMIPNNMNAKYLSEIFTIVFLLFSMQVIGK